MRTLSCSRIDQRWFRPWAVISVWLLLCALIACPWAHSTARASDRAPIDWAVAWSVAPLTVGIVEGTLERRLGRSTSVQGILAAGRGTTALWTTQQVRGLTMIEGRWLLQLGAQLRWYAVGRLARGIFAGIEARGLWLAGEQFVTGAAAGPGVGAKWTWSSGLTLEMHGGGVVALSTLQQRGTNERVFSWSLQGTARGAIGWSW